MNENNLNRVNECGAFLSCADYAEDDNRIYFANTNYNALTIVNKSNWTVEELIPFQDAGRSERDLYLRCIKMQNKICFLPTKANCVHVYDMESGSIRICGFGKKVDADQGKWDYFSCGEQVYLLPAENAQGLWLWKVEEDSVECQDWWNLSLDNISLMHGQIDERTFYSLGVGTNRLSISNVLERTVETVFLPDESISDITYDCEEENFWYTVNGSSDIVCWNRKEGVVDRYEMPYDISFPNGIITYLKIFYGFGKLFLILSGGDSLCLLNIEKRILEKVHAIECTRGYFFPREIEPTFKISGNQLICLLKNAGDVILIDRETMSIVQRGLDFKLNDAAEALMYKVLLDRNALIFEEKGAADLDMLLKYCKEK